MMKFLEVWLMLNILFWGGLYGGKFISNFIEEDVKKQWEKKNNKK